MAALPNSSDFNGSTVSKAGFKTAMANLRDFLAGLLGATGTVADAKTALGVLYEVAEVTLASASTVNIGAAASGNILVSGSVAITSFGTAAAGTVRNLRFAAAPLLTYNATTLILPSGANIQAAAGDCLEVESLGAGAWVVRSYTKADGKAVVAPAAPVTSVNGQTGAVSVPTPTTATVLGAITGASVFELGTHVVARTKDTSTTVATAGSVWSGTSLIRSGAIPSTDTIGVGTWRCMGANAAVSFSGGNYYGDFPTLWLRIA